MPPDPDFLNQYQALTTGVGLAIYSRSIVTLRGADRVTFLHSFCTNDIKQLSPGAGCEAFITSPQGKTVGHVLVVCRPATIHLVTSPGQSPALIEHFNRYLISEDVEFNDDSRNLATLLVSGPSAASALARFAPKAATLAMLQCTEAAMESSQLLVTRVPCLGEHTFFVHVRQTDLPAVQTALNNAGAIACDDPAVESVRLEAGFPQFGLDITPENLPQEIARDDQAISFRKGCYLGQETVARLDALGHVNRRLVRVQFSASNLPALGLPLSKGDKGVGQVTSAAWSPSLQAPLAFALVRSLHATAGALLDSAAGPATVIKTPP